MTADELVADYLTSLRRELKDLPRTRRRELLQEIEEHIAEGRAELLFDDEVGMRTLLDRIGDPAEIAAAARASDRPSREWRVRDIATILLLPFGGLVIPFVGWFVGVALLWTSTAWSSRDKVLGTLIVPGGLMPLLPFLAQFLVEPTGSCISQGTGEARITHCSPGAGTDAGDILMVVLLAVLLIAPLAMIGYLVRRRRPVAA